MSNALIIVPHFWDPICVPLGVSSLKSFAEREGHYVDLLDFNTDDQIFKIQNKYFTTVLEMFPYMKRWNIFRNGTEMLSIHQLLYLNARSKPYYADLVAEVMNMDGRNHSKFRDQLDVAVFDEIFDQLYLMAEKKTLWGLAPVLRHQSLLRSMLAAIHEFALRLFFRMFSHRDIIL